MHSVRDYLEKQSSDELKGILWTARMQPTLLPDEALVAIWDLLLSRGDLDPETIASSEKMVKEARKRVRSPAKTYDPNMLWYL
jgi:hypothetical protein